MARVTVEDCIEVIPNRFDLVVSAAQRAKQIASGAPLTLDRDNDKDAVVALREIAEKTVDLGALEEEVIASYSTYKMSESVHGSEATDEDLLTGGFASEAFADAVSGASAEQEEELEGAMSFDGENEDIND